MKATKKEVTHHVQGIFSKIIPDFFHSNHGGEKAMGWYVKSVERKRHSTKKSISSETIHKYEGDVKILPDK